jgi:hypothetical protein
MIETLNTHTPINRTLAMIDGGIQSESDVLVVATRLGLLGLGRVWR